MPFSVREGINIFLDGFIPTENMKFREEKLTFKVSENADEGELKHSFRHEYPKMLKVLIFIIFSHFQPFFVRKPASSSSPSTPVTLSSPRLLCY